LLLSSNGFRRALTGAGVGVGALAANRQTATVAQTTVAAEIHQALDIHRGLAAQIALDQMIGINRLADFHDFGVAQRVHTHVRGKTDGLADFLGFSRANTVNIGQCNQHPLVCRDIYTSNTSHPSLSSSPNRVVLTRVSHAPLRSARLYNLVLPSQQLDCLEYG